MTIAATLPRWVCVLEEAAAGPCNLLETWTNVTKLKLLDCEICRMVTNADQQDMELLDNK